MYHAVAVDKYKKSEDDASSDFENVPNMSEGSEHTDKCSDEDKVIETEDKDSEDSDDSEKSEASDSRHSWQKERFNGQRQ
jgi:hypothetical protein